MAAKEIKETFWEKQTTAFKGLLKAIKLDGEAQKIAKDSETPIEKYGAVKQWAKENWGAVILWGIAIFVIIRVMQEDNSPKRRGHHGVNRYGERY